MKALRAFNRNISNVNCVELEKKEALTALNWKIVELAALNRKKSGVKRQKTGKIAALTACNPKIALLTACNRKNSGVCGVELEIGWR